jgi:acetoacetyl-CoA synthetase
MTAQPSDEGVIWEPSPDARERSAMARFFWHCYDSGFPDRPPNPGVPHPDAPYAEWHRWSCENPERFWLGLLSFCTEIQHSWPSEDAAVFREVLRRGDRMVPPGPDGPAWFAGLELNFAEQLLGPHPQHDTAIIAHSEGGPRREFTNAAMRRAAAGVATELLKQGVRPGDVVAGFMPNIPETVFAMLGAAWIGATWTSCSPDFGVKGVLDRFGQVKPRVLFVADGYRYAGKEIDCLARVREIVDAIPSIERVVVVPFLKSALSAGDVKGIRAAVPWNDWISGGAEPEFVRLPFDHPLYIMYSSGTTGLPKCMVHGAGGTLLQHLKEHQLHCDIDQNDRVFYFTTCGWMMWNWLVSALASDATIVLYDGAPMPRAEPDILWRIASEEQITVFGTSAKYLAACDSARVVPLLVHNLDALRMILSTGSPLLEHGFDYVMRDVRPGVQLASISGGTDLISCFVLGNPLLPVRRGEIQCAGLGMAVDVFDESGNSVTGEPGELVCTRPFPSMPVAFWNDPDGSKYRDAYFNHFPGVWRHGDWVERTASDGFIVHGRSDATLNPGGVRIGTAEIYREVEQVEGVVESVVIGQDMPHASGGRETRVVLFVRLADGRTLDDALRERIRTRLREHASPHHVPKVIVQVNDIPRTISGKITELAVRDVVHGRAVKNTDALANPGALEEFRDRVELK